MKTLPALVAQTKSIIVTSNFDDFKAEADIFIDSINFDLIEPADYVQAKATIKNCKEVETNIQKALDKIIEESGDVGVLIKSMEHIKERFADARLELTPKVADEEKTIKKTAINKAKGEIEDFVVCLGRVIEPFGLTINFDADKLFADAIKGKRTSKSVDKALKDAVFELKKQIQANADLIKNNYAWYIKHVDEHAFLFSDLGMLVDKPHEDFVQIVNGRIDSHKLASEKTPVETIQDDIQGNGKQVGDTPTQPISTSEINLNTISGTPYKMPANDAPVGQDVTERVDKGNNAEFVDVIREWYDTQRRANRLRDQIIKKMNPFEQPGKMEYELAAGYKLIYTGTETREICNDYFEMVKTTLQQNGVDPNQLFFNMPMVSNAYGSLQPEIKEWIDSQCMTVTLDHKLKVVGPDETD